MADGVLDYFVTFSDGPLGLALEEVHGFLMVVRFVATPSGESGQAALLGVSLGSVLAEVVPARGSRLEYRDPIQALQNAPRPVRVKFQRSPKLLLPVPPPWPVQLWRGRGSVKLVCDDTASSPPLLSGWVCLSLVKDKAAGFRVIMHSSCLSQSSSDPVLEVLGDTPMPDTNSIGFKVAITTAHDALTHAAGLRKAKTGDWAADWRVAPSLMCLPASHASLAADTAAAVSAVAASALREGDTAPAEHQVALPHMAPCRALYNVQMQFEGATATPESLLPALAALRMPSEIALQASGSAGCRCVLEGNLYLWKSKLLGKSWSVCKFKLGSDGSLQWFAGEAGSGESYPWRPRGGICLSHTELITDPVHVSELSRLGLSAVRQRCVFILRSQGQLPRTVVVGAGTPANQRVWLRALGKMLRLMQTDAQMSSSASGPYMPSEIPPHMQPSSLAESLRSARALAGDVHGRSTTPDRPQNGPHMGGTHAHANGEDVLRDSEREMALMEASTPAVSNVWLRSASGSRNKGAPTSQHGPHGERPSMSAALRAERSHARHEAAQAGALPTLRWGSVEDAYRSACAAPPGRDLGGTRNVVLESIARLSETSPSLLSGATYSKLHPNAHLVCLAPGRIWKLARHNSEAVLGAVDRLGTLLIGTTSRSALFSSLQQQGWVGGGQPTMLPGGAEATKQGVQLQTPHHPEGKGAAPAHSSLEQVKQVLQSALPQQLFAVLSQAQAQPSLYFDDPEAAFAILIAASQALDSSTLHGAGTEAGGSPTAALDPVAVPEGADWGTLPPKAVRAACKNGILRRHHFVTLCGTFFEVLGDAFSAGGVFDALVEDTVPVTLQLRREADNVMQVTERVLAFEQFERYIHALRPGAVHRRLAWETVKSQLQLDPNEVLVKLEEFSDLVLTVKASAPVEQLPPLPSPGRLLPELMGMPTGEQLSEQLRDGLPLLESPHSWSVLSAPPHSYLSQLPPKRTMTSVLASLPSSTASACDQLRSWLEKNASGTVAKLWPSLFAPAPRIPATRANNRHRPTLVSPATLPGHGPFSSKPRLGPVEVKRPPSGRTFRQWARHRRRVARAFKFARRHAEETAKAATGSIAEQKALQHGPRSADAAPALQKELHSVFGASADEQGHSKGHASSEAAAPRMTSKQRKYLALIPPPGEGDSGAFTSADTDTADSFGDSTEEEDRLHAYHHGKSEESAPLPPIDEELLLLLDTGVGRAFVKHRQVSVQVQGSLMLSSRGVYFKTSPNEVLILPIHSLGAMEYCHTAIGLGGFVDNGLHLSQCDVRRVCPDAAQDDASAPSTLKIVFTLAQVLAAPTAAQARTLHAFRWRLHIEGFLDDYYSMRDPRGFPLESPLHSQIAGRTLDEQRGVQHQAPGSAQGGSRAPHQVFAHRITGARSVVTTWSGSAQSASATRSVQALDGRMSLALSSIRAVWDLLQSIPFSQAYNGAFSGIQVTLPGTIDPSVTLSFSHAKDLVLGQGEERVGGRRRVVREALEELRAGYVLSSRLGIRASALWGDLVERGSTLLVRWGSGQDLQPRTQLAWLKNRLARPFFEDETAALRLVSSAAINLIRTRALLKATGRLHGGLLFCSQALNQPQLRGTASMAGYSRGSSSRSHILCSVPATWSTPPPFQASELSTVLQPTGPGKEHSRLEKETAPLSQVLSDGYAWQNLPLDALSRQAVLHLRDTAHPPWLGRTLAFISKSPEVRLVRQADSRTVDVASAAATIRRLQQEVLLPVQTVRALVRYTLAWESPTLSATILMFLLLLAWWDVLHFLAPISLFILAFAILAHKSLPPDYVDWLHGALSLHREAIKQTSLMGRWKALQSSLGRIKLQLHIHMDFLQRVRALLCWRDPQRTRLFMFICVVGAIVLCLVPFRILFAAVLMSLFSKPLRDSSPGIFRLALDRFLDGLPVPFIGAGAYAPSSRVQETTAQGASVQVLCADDAQRAAQQLTLRRRAVAARKRNTVH